jgi:putative sterol carrier protein
VKDTAVSEDAADSWVKSLAAIVAATRTSPVFERKAQHLRAAAIAFVADNQTAGLEFHRGCVEMIDGRPLEGFDLVVSGPFEEWQRLLRGNISYSQACNIVHGRLSLQGNLLIAAWANQALSEFFRIAASVTGRSAWR